MATVPSIGRAGVEAPFEPEAEATRALYERYGNQVYGYCLHQLGSREEAEDAVQSTFLNAFRGLRRGVVPEIEQAWLFKIAQNVCLSRRRSSWRRGRIESPGAFEFAEETAPAPHRRADELIGLQEVLEHMPESQRRAILLREWQGLSYREIADELDVSQAAVETLIFRARRSLAQGLEASPAEQRSWRRKVRPSAALGNLLGTLKSLLASGLAVKAAGTAAVVAVTSVTAAPVVRELSMPHRSAHELRPAAVPASRPAVASLSSSAVRASGGAVGASRAKRHPAKHRRRPAESLALTTGAADAVTGAVPFAPAPQPPAAPTAPVPVEPAPVQPAEPPAPPSTGPAPASPPALPAPAAAAGAQSVSSASTGNGVRHDGKTVPSIPLRRDPPTPPQAGPWGRSHGGPSGPAQGAAWQATASQPAPQSPDGQDAGPQDGSPPQSTVTDATMPASDSQPPAGGTAPGQQPPGWTPPAPTPPSAPAPHESGNGWSFGFGPHH